MTIGQKVWVAEVGAGARPATICAAGEQEELRWERRNQCNVYSTVIAKRVLVAFSDEGRGTRSCYATSVFETREAAEKYLAE